MFAESGGWCAYMLCILLCLRAHVLCELGHSRVRVLASLRTCMWPLFCVLMCLRALMSLHTWHACLHTCFACLRAHVPYILVVLKCFMWCACFSNLFYITIRRTYMYCYNEHNFYLHFDIKLSSLILKPIFKERRKSITIK